MERPLDKPKLPKLRVPELLKFRDILQTLIASIEIRMGEIRETEVPAVLATWKKNTLRWLKYQRAAYVWLDNIIRQQKDYGDGESSL